MPASLFDFLAAALMETECALKPQRAQQLEDDWQTGKFHPFDSAAGCRPADAAAVCGRPENLKVVSGHKVARRNPGSAEGRVALLHAVAHIEYSAIDLALDHAYRFRGLPEAYYADWLRVAAEEAHHFRLLRALLQTAGYDYGDFPVHDSLWQMAHRTAHDVLARMALVPRLMEARGLDATPPIREKLAQAGDQEAVAVLDVILRDEIGHVAIGDHWFRHLCAERNLEPEAEYRRLIVVHRAPWPQLPMNEEARRAAGFGEQELARLAQRLP